MDIQHTPDEGCPVLAGPVVGYRNVPTPGQGFHLKENLRDTVPNIFNATPRILVLEYNNLLPAEMSVSAPYSPDFRATIPNFLEASLWAVVILSRKKGYQLVGCNRLAHNAFFLRTGGGGTFFLRCPSNPAFVRTTPTGTT